MIIAIPCHNEGKNIEATVREVRKYTDQPVYVYDNCSSDDTAEKAESLGCIVKYVSQKGKGNVFRRMGAELDDIVFMTDGDNTYSLENMMKATEMIHEGYDMVVGVRRNYFEENTARFHSFGNRLVNSLVERKYHCDMRDVMSGMRVFSPRFMNEFRPSGGGFELETEMTLFALDRGMKVGFVDTHYTEREDGDPSKVNAVLDGAKIVMTIVLHHRRQK